MNLQTKMIYLKYPMIWMTKSRFKFYAKTEISEDKNIKLISMHDEMSSSYLSYAMSVIVSRALPDIRDGLNLFTEEFYMQCTKVVMIGQNNLENQQE